MKKIRILIVDDDIQLLALVKKNLTNAGYEVSTAVSGVEAMKFLENEIPELLILDLKIPGMDGFEVCRKVRELSHLPIIIMSGLFDQEDKLHGFELGADDYMTKPVSLDELKARINVALRRANISQNTMHPDSFHCGDLQIDFAGRNVKVDGNEIKLTPTEFGLLKELVLSKGKVLTYQHLLRVIWGEEYGHEREYLHVFVGKLRAKLSRQDPTRYIATIPSIGYEFKPSSPSGQLKLQM